MNDSAFIRVHGFKSDGTAGSYSVGSGFSCVSAKACFTFAAVIVDIENNADIASFALVCNKRSKVLHCVKVIASSADNSAHFIAGKLKNDHAVFLSIGNFCFGITESNKNLLPGLTVSCRIIVDEIPDVVYIPLEALHVQADKSYVYKKVAGGYDKVEVLTGRTNTDYVIIEEGLDKDDRVALVDPTELADKADKKKEKKDTK
jgi:hypothetical protein